MMQSTTARLAWPGDAVRCDSTAGLWFAFGGGGMEGMAEADRRWRSSCRRAGGSTGWQQMQRRAKADEAGGGLNDAGCCTSLQKLGRPSVHAELAACKLVSGMHCGAPTNKYTTDLRSGVR
jgi:hypothetical protein